MAFGLLACCGEPFGLIGNEINENGVFMMRSECVEAGMKS
mgnify:FL=1